MAMVTEAFTALIAVEAPEDQDHTFTWESKRITPERLQHARDTIAGLHKPGDEPDMYSIFDSHKDLGESPPSSLRRCSVFLTQYISL